jgi:hypothetical protein
LDLSPGLIAILRSALERLEEDTPVSPGDPVILKFKQRILRSIAQLELSRGSLSAPDVVLPPEHAPPPAIQNRTPPQIIQPSPSQQHPPPTPQGQAGPPPPGAEPAPSPETVIVLVASRHRRGGSSAA